MTVNQDGQQAVVVFETRGNLDVLEAQAFEQETFDLIDRGARFFVIGLGQVELITSMGIRALLELMRKLQSHHGGLVLYGLNDRVKTVLSVTKLIDQFRIVASREEAMLEIAAARRASPAVSRHSLSSLTRLVGQVLGSATGKSSTGLPVADGVSDRPKSAVTTELARLFEEAGLNRPG